MSEQDVYTIAEWIVYNAEALYEKLQGIADDHMDPETFLYYEATQHFGRQYTLEDLNVAFSDDKLLQVIDLYFNREYNETDSLH